MEIQYLKEFVTLAKNGKYSSVSHNLHISQSTLTRHIQSLEKELGCELFIRTTRSIELSDEGKAIFDKCEEIVKDYEDIASILKTNSSLKNHTVRVGVVHNPNAYNIIDVIMEFNNKYSDIQLKVIEGLMADLKRSFDNGQLNIITMMYAPWEKQPDNFIPLGKTRPIAMMSMSHPLASKNKISLLDMQSEKIITPEENNYVYQYLRHMFKKLNITPNIFYQGNTTGIESILDQNNAILLQDYYAARNQLNDNLVIKEIKEDIECDFGLLVRNSLDPCEKAYIDFIRNNYHF